MMDPSTVPTLYREAQDLLRTDAEGAVARLTAASESGDLGSKFQLAVLLLDRDFEKAARLLMELDAAEFDGAARLLGMSYWTMDVEVAKRWYRRALARGGLDADRAAREFGLQMVNENPTEAARLLEQALNAGLAVLPSGWRPHWKEQIPFERSDCTTSPGPKQRSRKLTFAPDSSAGTWATWKALDAGMNGERPFMSRSPCSVCSL